MNEARSGLLVDTNVWLDFFLDRSTRHDLAGRFVVAAHSHGVPLFTPLHSVKDIYFLVGLELKRMEREAGNEISGSFADAVDEVAWSCVESVRKQSIIVGADEKDMLEAMMIRPQHSDFEDNLVVAGAKRSGARAIVSSDKKLLAHQCFPMFSLEQALEYAESVDAHAIGVRPNASH